MTGQKIKAYIDLTRLHFFFVWPTLFCAGLFLAFQSHDGFSLLLVLKAVLIGFFGFDAGLILNDIIDANIDKRDLPSDNRLTKYWRPFGGRPIPQGLISRRQATALFAVFAGITTVLIFTLSLPQSLYVFSIMIICYCLEVFYQIKKRKQKVPLAQVIGRVDFALFLVAGYLCIGNPDWTALMLFLFFYPLALAHLGVNDLIDVENDKARGMNTIPTLYGMKATTYWILGFSVFHFVMAGVFLFVLGSFWALGGFMVSLILLTLGNVMILKKKSTEVGLKALPLFHVSMLIYAITIIVNYAVTMLF
ncbi:MAG: UbiA family prenyltransferase [Candidatus Bathyarchaeota archaeon]|nr:UbiA family prenyltransferase [Candidatus Bathyarchaeota archaeon]